MNDVFTLKTAVLAPLVGPNLLFGLSRPELRPLDATGACAVSRRSLPTVLAPQFWGIACIHTTVHTYAHEPPGRLQKALLGCQGTPMSFR